MAKDLREYLETPNEKYRTSTYFIGQTKEITFDINFTSPDYSNMIGKVICKAAMEPFPRFRLFTEHSEIPTIPSHLLFNSINKVNRSLNFGYLKYQIKPVPSIFISYSLDAKLYNPSTKKKFFLETLDCLVDQLYIAIKELRNFGNEKSLKVISESYESSYYDSSNNCQECGENWTCMCSEGLGIEEEEIKICDKIKENMEKYSEIFDFDENFYDNGIYLYSPCNTLENQLIQYSLSENFINNFKDLIEKMIAKGLYCRKFPHKLLMVNLNPENLIDKVILAPAIDTDKKFDKWFTFDKIDDFLDLMDKEINNLLLINSKENRNTVEDYINISEFKYSDLESESRKIGEGGFAKVFINELNGEKVALKIPHLNKESQYESIKKIKNEFLACKNLRSKYIVKTYGMIKLPENKEGIVFQYLEGKTLKNKAEELTPKEVKYIMTKLAIGLKKMHKNDIIHQDLKPSNIIICENNSTHSNMNFRKYIPVIIDLGFAVKEEFRESTRGFTMEYADPHQLEGTSPGKPADIWSFALIYCSLLLKSGNPYYGSEIDLDLFKRLNKKDPKYKKISQDNKTKFLHAIKDQNIRPTFSKLENKVSEGILNMIKRCLDLNVDARPKIEEIHEILVKH